jgi:hypothetical protein
MMYTALLNLWAIAVFHKHHQVKYSNAVKIGVVVNRCVEGLECKFWRSEKDAILLILEMIFLIDN